MSLPVENKVEQVVMYGSPYLAMDREFISPKELLEWLSAVPEVGTKELIAYRALKEKIPFQEQYVNDGWHLLAKKPQYLLAIMSHSDINDEYLDTPDRNKDQHKEEDIQPLYVHCFETLSECSQTGRSSQSAASTRTVGLITGSVVRETLTPDEFTTYVAAGHFCHVNMAIDDINRSILCADRTNILRHNPNLYHLVVERVQFLQKNCPLYYVKVAFSRYYDVVKCLYDERLLHNLTKEDLVLLNNYFPGIIDCNLLEYSDEAYALSLMSPELAAYILGYPIHQGIPSPEQMDNALKTLNELGREKYAEMIVNYNNAYPGLPSPFLRGAPEQVKIANTENVLGDAVDSFSPFDILIFRKGEYLYRFTRAEFKSILENKKNPWTNEPLPASVLVDMEARMKKAGSCKLPTSLPICELLDKTMSRTLYQEEKLPPGSNPAPVSNHEYGNPFELLLHFMRNNVPITRLPYTTIAAQQNQTNPVETPAQNSLDQMRLSIQAFNQSTLPMFTFLTGTEPSVDQEEDEDEDTLPLD